MTVKVTLDNTIGAAFLGISGSCILTGIAIVQTHLYYHNYPKDWVFQKVAVGVLITLAMFHLIFTLHAGYYYLIINFGNLEALGYVVWSFKLQILVNALMILFVQGLYASRIWTLGTHFSRVWSAIVAFLVVGGWGLGFTLVVKTYEATSFTHLDAMNSIIYATFTTSTTIDVIIACTMCYYLHRSRSSSFAGHRTNNMLVTIMRYVLITGFLTSACSLSALITYATLKHTIVFIGIDFLLPNLYITSYIAMLNARKSMNEREPPSMDVSVVLRSGMTLRMDTQYVHTVDDDKMSSDGIPPSETRFTSSVPTQYDPERDTPSTHV